MNNQLARLSLLLAAFAAASFSPPALCAQVPASEPEPHIVEPIITEETMPTEPGEWDLRLTGSNFWEGSDRFGSLPRSQLFFGIADRWGGELEIPVAFVTEDKTNFGLGDLSTSLKYLARRPHPRSPGIVFGLEMEFPSGNTKRGLGEGALQTAPFIAAVQTSPHITLQGNVGYSFIHKTQESDAANQFFYNTAIAVHFPHNRLFFLAEVNGAHSASRNPIALSPGLKYHFHPERYIAVALPVGLNSDTPRLGIVVQFQMAIHSRE